MSEGVPEKIGGVTPEVSTETGAKSPPDVGTPPDVSVVPELGNLPIKVDNQPGVEVAFN